MMLLLCADMDKKNLEEKTIPCSYFTENGSMQVNSPCRQSFPPERLCCWATSKPMSDGEVEEEGDEDVEPGDDGGRHWELWLGTADWELCEGIWAELELLLLCMLPIPFSVRNSSKSMY